MYRLILIFIVLLLHQSCSVSNDVVSNRLLQKRKYQKGWHSNYSPKFENANTVAETKVESSDTTYSKEPLETKIVVKTESDSTSKNEYASNIYFNPIDSITEPDKDAKTNTSHAEINSISGAINKPESFTPTVNYVYQISPQIDRTDPVTRILLGLLGLAIIFFTGISPLAVLIAVGNGGGLRVNLGIYFTGLLFLAIALGVFILLGGFTLAFFVPLLTSLILILAANIHAIATIIRGY